MGAIICGLVLATLSLVAGPPGPSGEAPNSVDVAIPAGSEFNRDRPEAPPVIPGTEDTSGTESAPLVTTAESEATPLADTTPASVPVSGSDAPGEMEAPDTNGSDLSFSLGDDTKDEDIGANTPVIGDPNVSQEGVPETPDQPEIQIELANDADAQPVFSVPEDQTDNGVMETTALETTPVDQAAGDEKDSDMAIVLDLGETTDQAIEPESNEPLVITLGDNENTPEDEAPVLNLTLGDEADKSEDSGTGTNLFTADGGQGQSNVETPIIRLPTIGGGTDQGDTDVTAQEETAPETAGDAPVRLGALARNSRPFVAQDDKPLMAIVLIDVGDEGLGQEGLSTFSFPVTIALDPTKGNGLSAATKYRAAGLEVLIQSPPLPSGTTPQQVGERISSLVSFVPQAIGVVDSAQDGFGSNRRLIGEAIEVLNKDGHGLLTYDRGLNTAQQMAEKEGLPAGIIFRTIDAEREDAETIKRYLDRAAFRAGQDGNVIMIGHSYSDTVTAIFTWVQENRGSGVTLAPVSAILRN